MKIAGTGHRPNKLGGYGEEVREKLVRTAEVWLMAHPEVDEVISDIEGNVTDTQANVAALEETAAELDERLSTMAESAETFDTFLNTLRDLLVELQGLPPTPTATATPDAPPRARHGRRRRTWG